MVRPGRLAAIALLLAAASTANAPRAKVAAPAQGMFLVASRDLADPNFARAVVLLLDYGPGGAMGVVVNRRTAKTMAQAVPGLGERVPPTEPLYAGGPVERDELLLLARSAQALEGAREVLAGVWVSNSPKLLEDLVKGSRAGVGFRLYAGYSGWGPGQLDGELDAGGWHVVAATAEAIFATQPDELWHRLVPPDPLQIARDASSQEVRRR